MRYLKCLTLAALVLALSACASGKFKAPTCKGTFEPVNAPERYLKGGVHE